MRQFYRSVNGIPAAMSAASARLICRTMDKTLIERLEQKLRETGKSARAVSLAVSKNPDTIRNIQRGLTRDPKAEILKKIAAELGTTQDWLLGGTDPVDERPAPEVSPAPVPFPVATSMPNDVPVHGTAAASHLRGAFQFDAGVVDYVRRPPSLAGAKNAYALYVEGTSMQPKFDPGDLVFVHPDRPVRIGDTVIVQMEVAPHEIEASIGFLRRRTAETFIIGKLNPDADVHLPAAKVKRVHRVLSLNELFGL